MDKAKLIKKIVASLEGRWKKLAKAANEAREGATDSENKSESKYDTRGLEASYLAAGQAEQAAELADAIGAVQALPVRDFAADDPIALSALVAVKFPGETFHYLMVPAAGGVEVEIDGTVITTLAPQSPMAKALLGKREGEPVTLAPSAPQGQVGRVR
ncbi:hypothetical protein BH23VER1_BH23VER1_35010 [soil metagenome]